MLLRSRTWRVLVVVLCSCTGAHCSNTTSIFLGFKVPQSTFGPYKLAYKSVDTCEATKGRRAANSCVSKVYLNKVSRYYEDVEGFLYLPEDVILTEGRIVADFWKNNAYQPTYFSQFKNPCQHPIFSKAMVYAKPDKNCKVKQGNYTITGLNSDKLMHRVMDKLVYARAIITLEWIQGDEVVCCYKGVMESTPLREPAKGGRRRANGR